MADRHQRQRAHTPAKARTKKWPAKMKAGEAQKFLGCSPAKLTMLLLSGQLAFDTDPLDRRSKLIKRSDLEALLRQRGRG